MSLVTCHPSWVSKRLHTLLYWIVLFCIVLNYYTGTPLSPVDYFPGSPVIMYKYTNIHTVSYTIRWSVCNQSVRQWLVVEGVTFFHCLGGDPWASHRLQCPAVFALASRPPRPPNMLVHVMLLEMGKACCHWMQELLHKRKQREFLLLSKRSCCQASTVDFSCW